MQVKSFKVQKSALFIITYVSCALLAIMAFFMLVTLYPDGDMTAPIVLFLCSFITFMIVFPFQRMTLTISDSELIMDVLLFKNVIRFEDVEECYIVNGRMMSFYLRDGRQLKYRIYIYEDPDGIQRELDKHIKVKRL